MLNDGAVVRKCGITCEAKNTKVNISFVGGKLIIVDLFKDRLLSGDGNLKLPNNFKVGDGVVWYGNYYIIADIQFPDWMYK